MKGATRLRKLLTGRPAFPDPRSGKVIFVPHCALNQNARVAGAAERPAGVVELVAGLLERDIGIIQMPCPELYAFGLDRAGMEIESELRKSSGRELCRRLARELVQQIREYRSCGVALLGVLGKNGSPACGVEETWDRGGVCPGSGAYIEELAAELRESKIRIEIRGIRDDEPSTALETVDRWLSSSGTV
jgi:predicted secreted protein